MTEQREPTEATTAWGGPFHADFDLAELSRAELAVLDREYLMAGHLIDRAGIPQVLARSDQDAARDAAIEEWMSSSPIWTQRTKRALGFAGTDVATIFKGMQFDIGAPHQFLDFRYTVHDEDHGEFYLAHCGALMDAEPMGESFVTMMCHDIEDPTFDATALATNPRAQVRPIHRPPRVPAGRDPHCHWTVTINHDAADVEAHPNLARVAASKAATLVIDHHDAPGAEAGGRDDYAGPLDPDFQFEHLSTRALVTMADEIALQGHLLVRAFLLSISERFGPDVAAEIATQQLVGVAGVVTQRLRRCTGITGDDAASIARIFQLHPAFRPRAYVDLRVDVIGDGGDAVRVSLHPCAALDEGDEHSWFARFGTEPHAALSCIAETVNPRASVAPTAAAEVPTGAVWSWDVTVDPTAEPARERPEVSLTAISTGADFVFRTPEVAVELTARD